MRVLTVCVMSGVAGAVLVAPAFGLLDRPGFFQPFFTELHRKDDRCTTLVERPHQHEGRQCVENRVELGRIISEIPISYSKASLAGRPLTLMFVLY